MPFSQPFAQRVAFKCPNLVLSVLQRDLAAKFFVEVFGACAGAFAHHGETVFQHDAANRNGGAGENVILSGHLYLFDSLWRHAWCGQTLVLNPLLDCFVVHVQILQLCRIGRDTANPSLQRDARKLAPLSYALDGAGRSQCHKNRIQFFPPESASHPQRKFRPLAMYHDRRPFVVRPGIDRHAHVSSIKKNLFAVGLHRFQLHHSSLPNSALKRDGAMLRFAHGLRLRNQMDRVQITTSEDWSLS